MSGHFSDKGKEKKIAKEHIDELFREAKEAFSIDPALSDSYVKKTRAIQMKFRLRMPSEYKRKFCKNCNKYLVPPVNARVRINGGKIIYTCSSCKKIMRIPLNQKK